MSKNYTCLRCSRPLREGWSIYCSDGCENYFGRDVRAKLRGFKGNLSCDKVYEIIERNPEELSEEQRGEVSGLVECFNNWQESKRIQSEALLKGRGSVA